MVRSAAALVALLILPIIVAAQETTPVNHTVVVGDCLWYLAGHYYEDPFEWRVIWNANRSDIEDPNLIFPDQVFAVPGARTGPPASSPPGRCAGGGAVPPPAVVEAVVVEGDVPVEVLGDPIELPVEEPAEEPVEEPVEQAEQLAAAPLPPMASQRTVFFPRTSSVRDGIRASDEIAFLAVSRDVVYSAPRLEEISGHPENQGRVEDFAAAGAPSGTVRSYDRVRLTVTGPRPRVGDRYQLFRTDRILERVGKVVIPTGVATVTESTDEHVVAIVDKEYHRVELGDFIGPLPSFPMVPGQEAQAVTGGSAAMVMGFAQRGAVRDLNDIAFLDLGTIDGIALGDEFELFNPAAGAGVVEGRLQVVGVSPETVAARITGMSDAVFHQGIVVRLTKKMR